MVGIGHCRTHNLFERLFKTLCVDGIGDEGGVEQLCMMILHFGDDKSFCAAPSKSLITITYVFVDLI